MMAVWKKVNTKIEMKSRDYYWFKPNKSLGIFHLQDRDGKNAFMYYLELGVDGLGGTKYTTLWKGRNVELAIAKAQIYMREHIND
jgi:hypothetical protein